MENIDKKVLIEILKKQLEINRQLVKVIGSCAGVVSTNPDVQKLIAQVTSLKKSLEDVQ